MASIPTDHLFSQQTGSPPRKAVAVGTTPFADQWKPPRPAAAPATPSATTRSAGKTQQDQTGQQRRTAETTTSQPRTTANPATAENPSPTDLPQNQQATAGTVERPNDKGTEAAADSTPPVNENTSQPDEADENVAPVDGQPDSTEATPTSDLTPAAEAIEAAAEKGQAKIVDVAPELAPTDADDVPVVPSTSRPSAETASAANAGERDNQRRPAADALSPGPRPAAAAPNHPVQARATAQNNKATSRPQGGAEIVSGTTVEADTIVAAAAAVDTDSAESAATLPTDGIEKGSSRTGRVKGTDEKSTRGLTRSNPSTAGARERASGTVASKSAAGSLHEAPELDVNDRTSSQSLAADSIAAAKTAPLAPATRTNTQATFTIDNSVSASAEEAVESPTIASDSGPKGRSPQQVYADSASATQRGTGPPAVDPRQLVQRVTRAFQTAHERGGPIRLRLSPPELGSLRLEVELKGDTLTARIETETVQARDRLMQNLSVLRERLIEHGIRIEQFDVDLMQHSGQSPDQPTDRSTDESASWPRKPVVTVDESPVSEEPRQWQRPGDGGLNVVV